MRARFNVSQVVSVAAHELKNPISVLKGYLDALSSEDLGKLNAKQKEYIGDMLENLQRMRVVVNSLLDVAQIEEKGYHLRPKRFNLEKLTAEILEGFSHWAKALNCTIEMTPPSFRPSVFADPVKIRQVVENLISNAIKYRGLRKGHVRITFEREGRKVALHVQDNGIGIPPQDFSKVFSKFYRSEKGVTLDPSGTGLGLYINRAIIELSGGNIWFEKNKGPGMTFSFSLPSP